MLLMLFQSLVGGARPEAWQDWLYDKIGLERELDKQEKVEAKIEKKIVAVKKKLEKARHPEGILANLHSLQSRRGEVVRVIKDLRIQIEWADPQFEDEEDEELLFLQ